MEKPKFLKEYYEDESGKYGEDVLVFDDRIHAILCLNSFQDGDHKGSNIHINQLKFDLLFDEDKNMSGVVEEFLIDIETEDNKHKIYTFTEVDPDKLYLFGKALADIAKHLGASEKLKEEKK
jgi:hypothetical protein